MEDTIENNRSQRPRFGVPSSFLTSTVDTNAMDIHKFIHTSKAYHFAPVVQLNVLMNLFLEVQQEGKCFLVLKECNVRHNGWRTCLGGVIHGHVYRTQVHGRGSSACITRQGVTRGIARPRRQLHGVVQLVAT